MDKLQLNKIEFDSKMPFQLEGIELEGIELECLEILRLLPNRRIVCRASFEGKIVVAKLFIHPQKSQHDYEQELSGYHSLSQSKVLTPKLVTNGCLEQNVFYVLYEYIEHTKSLGDCIPFKPVNYSLNLIESLITLVVQMHHSSIKQNDLHLNNFLLLENNNEQLFYTIDCGDIEQLSQLESEKIAQIYNNLGCLFSQLPISYDQFLQPFFNHYQALSKYPHQLSISLLEEQVGYWRKRRSRKYLKKISRTCSEFILTKNWLQIQVIKRQYSNQKWLDFYQSIDAMVESSMRLKDGNTATVCMAECDAVKVVIKRYNIKNLKHYLTRFWRPTRAWNSWQNAHQLSVFGIKTPVPIAIIEKRFGWLRSQAFYISEYEANEDALSTLSGLKGESEIEASKAQIEDFKQLFSSMIYSKMSHGDLKANNILMTKDGLSFIDLDAMKFHSNQASFDKAFKRDLKRFIRNWPRGSKLYHQFDKMIKNLPKLG